MTAKSKLLRMDNVLIVVDDLEAAKAFFAELGMELDHGITFSVTARSSMLLDITAYSDETGLPDTYRIRRVEQIRENPNMGRDALLLFVQHEANKVRVRPPSQMFLKRAEDR
jgi:catechol 2,3-dioxygenase-like lactoylglutathione lyase family enzyme